MITTARIRPPIRVHLGWHWGHGSGPGLRLRRRGLVATGELAPGGTALAPRTGRRLLGGLAVGICGLTLSASLLASPAAGALVTPVVPSLSGQVTDVAYDAQGNLYLTEAPSASNAGSILVRPSASGSLFGTPVSAGRLTQVAAIPAGAGGGGIAFDAAGNLYVTGPGGTVSVLSDCAVSCTIFGQTVAQDTLTPLFTGLTGAQGLAFDSNGNLYVATATGVTVIAGHTTSLFGQTFAANTPKQLFTGLTQGYSVALDASGNVYVSDATTQTVSVYTAGAASIFGQPVTALTLTAIASIQNASGLSFDPTTGNLYMTGFNTITVLSNSSGSIDGTAVTAGQPTLLANGLYSAEGSTFFSGSLYVADQGNNSVDELGPATATITGVTFSGSVDEPMVTVTGTGFTTAPSVGSCGFTGRDYPYGNLYLLDGPRGWGAGIPGDCIGLNLVELTSTQVVFSLGDFYAGNFTLASGDSFTVGVDGAVFIGTVSYTSSPLPSNGVIAFDCSGICLIKPDGTDLTALPTPSDAQHPRWSPDGALITYASGGQIWVMAANGSKQTQLTTTGGADPSFSANGADVLYDNAGSIYEVSIDGGTPTAVAIGVSPVADPVQSPDGQSIAVADDSSGPDQGIWVSTSGTATQLTAGIDVNPAWTPDGSEIDFERSVSSSWQLDQISPTTPLQPPTQLVAAYAENAAPSPDGTELAYVGPSNAIFVASANGSGGVAIPNTGTTSFSPSWQPVLATFTPALTSAATTGPVAPGTTITDAVTLSAASPVADGTITFNAYGNSSCTGTALDTEMVTVAGPGVYTAAGFQPSQPGTYYWTTSYTGDPVSGTLAATQGCGAAGASTVVGYLPMLSTSVTPGVGPDPVGTAIGDTATLAGTAPAAAGSITFNAYPNSGCTGAPAYSQTLTVSGPGSYATATFQPASPGTYYWIAAYTGDPATNTLGVSEPCGGANESTTLIAAATNDAWTRAQLIPLDANGNGSATGSIDMSGQARWYKVAVTPGGTLQVDLTNLPANYDLAVFSDIGQAYNNLTSSASLQADSAEYATSAFSPSVFSPSVFSPSVFSPSVFSPSVFSPSVFSPSVFSPSVFSPSVFSPSVFSPSVFSPSVFSPINPDPNAADYAGAQVQSLLAVSDNPGTADQQVFTDIWNNTGYFYIRVNGPNGDYDPGVPFSLSVHENSGTCTGVAPSSAPLLSTTPPGPGYQTAILTDYSRMTNDGNLAAMESTLGTFAARSEVKGTIVQLDQISPQVNALEAQADANTGCPYAENLVASAIRNVVLAYRAANPGLKYVVIIGDDHVIPFFRYPDTAGIGPESDYDPPVLDTSASYASLASNDVLSQDAYGASTILQISGQQVPVPNLPVGRLVKTPTEIIGMLNAYLSTAAGVVATPTSSLVTGYDFMTSGADAVESNLSAGLGAGARTDTLITNDGVSPSNTGTPPNQSWTATQLESALLGSRHDLIFLAGHFSANNTLAADFSTTMNATDLAASSVNLENSIVFSAGCHSGYDIVNGDAVPGVTQTLDWTEAFAQKQATLIAGTGYQYGDTDFLAYSEQLYANFSYDLRLGSGPVAVGNALVQAKDTYLDDTPNLQGIDIKALLESTLYGLPMLSVNLPAGRITTSPAGSIVASTTATTTNPGAALGLSSAVVDLAPTLSTNTTQLESPTGGAAPLATYLSGPQGVELSPGAPTLPLAISDVGGVGAVGGNTCGAGAATPTCVLRGVGFLGGSYSDRSGITPLTGAPGTELSGVHSPFVSSAFYPSRLWSVDYYPGLTGTGSSPTDAELMLTPVQYESDGPNSTTDTQRTYSDVKLQLFYSSNTQTYGANTPSLAAPPTISRVDASSVGDVVNFSVHAVGDPSAGIQQVWVTYTGVDAGKWESLDLTQDTTDSTLWTGSLTLPGFSTAQIDAMQFVVQAVNGVGLVSLDDNQGAYYQPNAIPPALTNALLAPTCLALDAPSSSAPYGTAVSLSATLRTGGGSSCSSGAAVPNASVSFSVGGSSLLATTNGSGVATVQLPLIGTPGSYDLTAGFAGTTSLASASAVSPFSIGTLTTTLGLSAAVGPVVDGTDTGISAALQSGGIGVSEHTVAFVLTPTGGGAPVIQTRITNLYGNAALGVVSQPLDGTYTVRAYFGPGGPFALPADPIFQSAVSGSSQLTVTASVPDLEALLSSYRLKGIYASALSTLLVVAAKEQSIGTSKQAFCLTMSAFSGAVLSDGLSQPPGFLLNPPLSLLQTSALVSLANAIETGSGCGGPTRAVATAEQSALALATTINGFHLPAATLAGLDSPLAALGLELGLGDTRASCQSLGAFVAISFEDAFPGSPRTGNPALTVTEVAQLVAAANQIGATLACPAAAAPFPAAEQSVLTLGTTIGASHLPTATLAGLDAPLGALGSDLGLGDTRDACESLSLFIGAVNTAASHESSGLTVAEAATLVSAAKPIGVALHC